jgi:hypothetical protein
LQFIIDNLPIFTNSKVSFNHPLLQIVVQWRRVKLK